MFSACCYGSLSFPFRFFFFLYCALHSVPLRASLSIFSLILFSVLNWDTFGLDVSTEAEEDVERDGGRMTLVGQRAITSHLPECTEKKEWIELSAPEKPDLELKQPIWQHVSANDGVFGFSTIQKAVFFLNLLWQVSALIKPGLMGKNRTSQTNKWLQTVFFFRILFPPRSEEHRRRQPMRLKCWRFQHLHVGKRVPDKSEMVNTAAKSSPINIQSMHISFNSLGFWCWSDRC